MFSLWPSVPLQLCGRVASVVPSPSSEVTTVWSIPATLGVSRVQSAGLSLPQISARLRVEPDFTQGAPATRSLVQLSVESLQVPSAPQTYWQATDTLLPSVRVPGNAVVSGMASPSSRVVMVWSGLSAVLANCKMQSAGLSFPQTSLMLTVAPLLVHGPLSTITSVVQISSRSLQFPDSFQLYWQTTDSL